MEEGGAEATAGEAQSDAASPGRRRLGFGAGDGEVGVGRHGCGPILAAAKPDKHLHNPRELVLRAGGVRGGEVPGHAEDVNGGGALHGGALSHREKVVTITTGASRVALGEKERD